jgi:hypothetical protein
MSFDTAKAPPLFDEDPPTSTSKAHTLYLLIDLEVPPGTDPGKPVAPITAVFAPEPDQLPASDVDVILWLHGDKSFWSTKRGKQEDKWGISVQDYLQQPETQLREFILRSANKKFLLVVPTLADHSSSETHKMPAGGLLGDPDKAKAYLDVVRLGVNAYMKRTNGKPIGLTGLDKLVLAAHSGGGRILGNMAGFGGDFDKKVEEIWCFDCTYWDNIINWAKKGHAGRRLFVYSSGEGLRDMKNPNFDPQKPKGKDNPKTIPNPDKPFGTGFNARDILDLTRQKSPPSTTIEVLIEAAVGNLVNGDSTPHFVATYGRPDGQKHYESIEKYLTQLVDSSKILK